MPAVSPVRAPRLPPPGSPAVIYQAELAERRTYLDVLRVHHLDLARRFLSEAEGRLWTLDLVIGAVLTRSYSLVDGFISAFDTWNPVVAAPILRMQIDSLVRLAYIATAPRADEVAAQVLQGEEFRHMKDADGKKLTDARLLQLASSTHPWLQAVYNATSGWVHFSPKHVRAVWQVSDASAEDGQAELFGAIPLRPEQIPLSALQELLLAMIQGTEELFGYVEVWESRKGLPLGQARDLGGTSPQ